MSGTNNSPGWLYPRRNKWRHASRSDGGCSASQRRICVLLIFFSISTAGGRSSAESSDDSSGAAAAEMTSMTNVCSAGRPASSRFLSTEDGRASYVSGGSICIKVDLSLTCRSAGGRLLAEDERLDVGLGRGWPIDVLYRHDMVFLEPGPEQPTEALCPGESDRERLEPVRKGLLGEQGCIRDADDDLAGREGQRRRQEDLVTRMKMVERAYEARSSGSAI